MHPMTTKPAPSGLAGRRDGQGKAAVIGRHHNSTTSVPIWAGGKIVGEVRGDTFFKRVRGSKHMLLRPLAWALDLQSLQDAEVAGAREVEIHDVETNRRYRAAIALLRSDKANELDRGFGRQIALPLKLWQVEDADAKQLALW